MKLRFGNLAFLLFGVGTAASAQNCISPSTGSLLGVSFDMADFVTPARIRNSTLSHVVNHGEWAKWPDHDLGFSVMYWQGISKRLDLSVQYNGLVSSHLMRSTSRQYVNELEAAFQMKALKDDHVLNPFLTAGIGAGYYGNKFAGYTPLGIGVQANIHSRTYLFLQANYRLSFARSVIDDNLFYSLGVAENLSGGHKRHAEPKTVVVPVVIDYDRDKDGVPDSVDACPDIAGLPAFQGCPDSDGDGVNDELDKCPTVPGLAKYNGCPIPDTDGDGVNDEMDKCPTVPGPASNNGCPEVKKEVVEKASYAAKHIFFATGKAALLPKSFAALNDIAVLMEANPTLRLDIAGYTDNTGTPAKNLALSQGRADAVEAYLAKKQVDISRMTSTGFGQDNPVADNKTAAGRGINRRVELKLKAY